MYPFANGPFFILALRSMRAIATPTHPAFDADLLSATPLADTFPFAFLDQFLATRPQISRLSLLNFVGVPPGAGEVPSTAVPHLTTVMLDGSPGLATALAPGRPVDRVTLRIAKYIV